MRDVLLSRRWVWRHALAVAAFLTCVGCAYWQLSRAESPSGDLQNWGYALEWPLFAGFVVFAWWKTMRMEAQQAAEDAEAAKADGARQDGEPEPSPSTTEPVRPAVAETAPQPVVRSAALSPREAAEAELAAIRARAAADAEEEDPKLTEYNQYLARLNARHD